MKITTMIHFKYHVIKLITGIAVLLFCLQLQASDQGSFEVEIKGKGQVLILIPGLMSDASVFNNLAAELSPHFEVHLVSVKGFASTPGGDDFNLSTLVQDILSYIDKNNLPRPDVVGHSMGGLTGFVLASNHQDKIGKLVSVDGLPFIGPIFTRTNSTTVDMMMSQAQNIKAIYANMTRQQLAAQTQQGVFIQATSAQDQSRIVDMAKQSNPVAVGNAMFDVMTTDMRKPLSQSNTHILMLGASGV
jgi:pimeloyl-ACP methyl ester carboxylesterase